MITIPASEAKARLSELLTRAEPGEEITITRHGVPVARLVAASATVGTRPAGLAQRDAVEAVFSVLPALRRGVMLDLPLREAIEQGRD